LVTTAHPRPAHPGQGPGALFTVRFPLRQDASA
jgi:hypothetical protein